MQTFLVFSLGTTISILTIIGKWNHLQVSLVHEGKGDQGFPQAFNLQRKTKSRKGFMGGFLNLWLLACFKGGRDL
jgi:hypothetical protein